MSQPPDGAPATKGHATLQGPYTANGMEPDKGQSIPVCKESRDFKRHDSHRFLVPWPLNLLLELMAYSNTSRADPIQQTLKNSSKSPRRDTQTPLQIRQKGGLQCPNSCKINALASILPSYAELNLLNLSNS